MEYTLDYFIRKFEAIPEELWCRGKFRENRQKCALGHCGASDAEFIPHEAIKLYLLLKRLPITNLRTFTDKRFQLITNINDCFTNEYRQPTPKQRILAALNDIKKLQLKTVDEMLSKVMEVQEGDATEDESSIEVGSINSII